MARALKTAAGPTGNTGPADAGRHSLLTRLYPVKSTKVRTRSGQPAPRIRAMPPPSLRDRTSASRLPNRIAGGWRFRAERPDASTLGWIRDPGSLTARLLARAGGDFRVRLNRLAWARPTRDEASQLRLPYGEWALIREVVLEGRGQPWVTARSVIPRGSLTGRNRQLRRLGTRPLGAFLFRDPGLRRDEVRVVRDAGGHWGRRSRFLLRGQPLLVAEYFLPALLGPDPIAPEGAPAGQAP